jgi:TatD DNase family protein
VDGLDHELQRHYFLGQLRLARERDLPVIVHARGALEEASLTLRRIGGLRGVVHSFSGSEQQARQLWEIGFHLGIGGPVTYPRAQRLRRIVAQMPIEFLLLESDAPDQPDAAHRGERNEPARVAEVLQCVAGLRGEPALDIAAATSANAHRLFGLVRQNN